MADFPKQLADLIERFERNREAYESPAYNETQLRVEFIDPFFEQLGWDVHNRTVTGRQIDRLGYEFYGLTDEEKALVEGTAQ